MLIIVTNVFLFEFPKILGIKTCQDLQLALKMTAVLMILGITGETNVERKGVYETDFLHFQFLCPGACVKMALKLLILSQISELISENAV